MSSSTHASRKIRCKMCRCVLASSDDLLGHGLFDPLFNTPSSAYREATSSVTADSNEEKASFRADGEAQDTGNELPQESLNTTTELSSTESSSATSSVSSTTQSPISELTENWRPSMIKESCSGYFIDPTSLKWIEAVVREGHSAGKISCPNKKCRSKLGNYDWAGVCCSCKEWVTPHVRLSALAGRKWMKFYHNEQAGSRSSTPAATWSPIVVAVSPDEPHRRV